jgi:hypothetical protein
MFYLHDYCFLAFGSLLACLASLPHAHLHSLHVLADERRFVDASDADSSQRTKTPLVPSLSVIQCSVPLLNAQRAPL